MYRRAKLFVMWMIVGSNKIKWNENVYSSVLPVEDDDEVLTTFVIRTTNEVDGVHETDVVESFTSTVDNEVVIDAITIDR